MKPKLIIGDDYRQPGEEPAIIKYALVDFIAWLLIDRTRK